MKKIKSIELITPKNYKPKKPKTIVKKDNTILVLIKYVPI